MQPARRLGGGPTGRTGPRHCRLLEPPPSPRLRVLTQSEGLTGPDLLSAFVARRVLPLQGRPHMICQMSGHRDPSRLCTKEMPHAEVAHMVNYLANCKLTDEWRFGKEPYSCADPLPMVSFFFFSFLFCCRVLLG